MQAVICRQQQLWSPCKVSVNIRCKTFTGKHFKEDFLGAVSHKMPRNRKDSGPSLEEIVFNLETKIETIEDKNDKKRNELEERLQCISHTMDNRLSALEESSQKKNTEVDEKLKEGFHLKEVAIKT